MSEALLSLNGVSVRRGSSMVLNDVSLDVTSGQLVLLKDKNGAGKSTIIEVAAGLLPLEKGEVLHNDEVLIDESGRSKRPKSAFGLTLQSDGCVGSLRVKEHLLNALDLAGGRIDVNPWLE
ncbi:MAG: hypothetical protein CL959_06870, partial [Euryarchaeota archaeon]|nr:hypothetical protein [Euryarchaeota archaeon]